MTLVSKDEPLRTSMVYIGYLILKRLEKASEARLSLPELAKHLNAHGVNEYRPIMFGLVFLYSVGAIDFKAPYIYKIK